jgi:hypothetical protein
MQVAAVDLLLLALCAPHGVVDCQVCHDAAMLLLLLLLLLLLGCCLLCRSGAAAILLTNRRSEAR